MNLINITTFCDVQGVDKFNRVALTKKFQKTKLTYSNFYDLISQEFKIGDKKEIETQKIVTEEVLEEIVEKETVKTNKEKVKS